MSIILFVLPIEIMLHYQICCSTVCYHCLHGFRVILWMLFYPVFVFSAAFTVFIVLTVCLSVMSS